MNTQRERAQQLLNHLAPDQVAARVHSMEVVLDPLSCKRALPPFGLTVTDCGTMAKTPLAEENGRSARIHS